MQKYNYYEVLYYCLAGCNESLQTIFQESLLLLGCYEYCDAGTSNTCSAYDIIQTTLDHYSTMWRAW